jgi:hypothetical protein
MSENENIDPKKPARTSKASATPHKPGCGCPRCVYRRRKAGVWTRIRSAPATR